MKRLILAGGGHAHLAVIEALAHAVLADVEVVMITEQRWQYYSGMLPGWIAGHYQLDDWRIDWQPLLQSAGVRLVQQRITALDADQQLLTLADGSQWHYDWLSLDVGSGTRDFDPGVSCPVLPVKPLADFQQQWACQRWSAASSLVVVGSGAAGIELVLSMRYALPDYVQIYLQPGRRGILPGFSRLVRCRVQKLLDQRAIQWLSEDTAPAAYRQAQLVVTATGAQAPTWLKHSGLALSAEGFVRVDASHRSPSHDAVFAAGDVCHRDDVTLPRSGVHAVKAGPVLARNLISALHQQWPRARYRPRRYNLYILACGPRDAIASYGPLSCRGRWVWYWKNWLDQRFMQRFL